MTSLCALMTLSSFAATAFFSGESRPVAESTTMHSNPSPRIVRLNGVPTLEVDGAPWLVFGAQCDIWRSTKQDAKAAAFFSGYRDMHASTVSVGIPWSKVETKQDHYDFRFIDWFIAQAESNGLKLVLNLFDTNVCGKVSEGSGSSVYPGYTPSYLLDQPTQYQRMVLPYPYRYVEDGPPMCPNDPNTLERELLYVRRVAEHLRETDRKHTVVMLQINNEYYYQQWKGKGPANEEETVAVRCQCPRCLVKWEAGHYANGEQFMFESFADYTKVLADAIEKIHPLPIYVNSPWWPPRVIPIFLARCPNLAFVGIDGILTPREPNWLSDCQLDRNIPFAAENPTENSEVRQNLDVLPYYTILGREGIGNLLWECHEPFTVVDDPKARKRFGDALLPLRNAMNPIARARGTDRFLGWYAIRDLRSDLTTDIFGNFVPAKEDQSPVSEDRWFVREGRTSRTEPTGRFKAELGGLGIEVADSQAGVAVWTPEGELVLALPNGTVTVTGVDGVSAERGRYIGERWQGESRLAVKVASGKVVIEAPEPCVVRLSFPRKGRG